MKTLHQVREILADNFTYLEQEYKIKKIGVFDPYAGEETPFDDIINILVEISNPAGWEYDDLHDFLENLLELKVHITATRSLEGEEKEKAQNETKYI